MVNITSNLAAENNIGVVNWSYSSSCSAQADIFYIIFKRTYFNIILNCQKLEFKGEKWPGDIFLGMYPVFQYMAVMHPDRIRDLLGN